MNNVVSKWWYTDTVSYEVGSRLYLRTRCCSAVERSVRLSFNTTKSNGTTNNTTTANSYSQLPFVVTLLHSTHAYMATSWYSPHCTHLNWRLVGMLAFVLAHSKAAFHKKLSRDSNSVLASPFSGHSFPRAGNACSMTLGDIALYTSLLLLFNPYTLSCSLSLWNAPCLRWKCRARIVVETKLVVKNQSRKTSTRTPSQTCWFNCA